jgi:3-keto-L-gulonate-6-phosphate decarboxylase
VRAGAEILIVGTSIFHTADPAAAVQALRQLAVSTRAQKV